MEKLDFYYFPFEIGDEEEVVIPCFEAADVKKLSCYPNASFRIKIFGHQLGILQISQTAEMMERMLGGCDLEWEYVEKGTIKNILAAVQIINEKENRWSGEDAELRQLIMRMAPLFRYWLREILEHGLGNEAFWLELKRLGINYDDENVLQSLLLQRSARDIWNENWLKFNVAIDRLDSHLLQVDSDLRSVLWALLEDNDFISGRQVTLLLELNYLFSLFLNGLTNIDFCEFMSKVKALITHLGSDNLTPIKKPLGR